MTLEALLKGAGEAVLTIRRLRDVPADELEGLETDFLEKAARHLRAASYSAHVVARRFESIVRRRRGPAAHGAGCECVICVRLAAERSRDDLEEPSPSTEGGTNP